MNKICKNCLNRCKVIDYFTKRKIGEICYIRYDAGGFCDPVNNVLDSEKCPYYELNIKTMRKLK